MDVIQAIILGIVQGVSEWLPISSKSHLILAQMLMGISPPVIFDLILHLGSFVAVVIFFWNDIRDLIVGLWNRDRDSWMMFWFIVVASVPIAVIGYLFEKVVKVQLFNLTLMGWGFLFTALVIFFSRYNVKQKGLNYWNSFIVGISQVLALLPGVSRSGVTISTGMLLGIKKDVIARFSFLIFIPAIFGAAVLEFKDVGSVGGGFSVLIVGFVVAAIVGMIALKLLMFIIKKDNFSWFSVYCAVLGIVVLLFAYGVL